MLPLISLWPEKYLLYKDVGYKCQTEMTSYMGLDARKPVFGVSDQVRSKPVLLLSNRDLKHCLCMLDIVQIDLSAMEHRLPNMYIVLR